jgi:hypothetical protein
MSLHFFLHRLASRPVLPRHNRAARRVRLFLEPLEDRTERTSFCDASEVARLHIQITGGNKAK